jgi:thymidylate kinase
MIVVVEGFDGCGKNSVADALAAYLGGAKRLDFPERTSPTGVMIDAYLKREWWVQTKHFPDTSRPSDLLGAQAFQALCLANRLENYEALLMAAGDARTHLVLGRYWMSGWVYGQLDGLSKEWVELTNKFFPDPDLAVLLDASAETCLARRAARDGRAIAPERYEGKLAMGQRAVGLYRELWFTKSWDPTWVKADAELPLDRVVRDLEVIVDGAL